MAKTLIASISTLLLALFWVPPAQAAAIIFNTSDSQFDAGVENQGWWAATFNNTDANDNYVTGGDVVVHRSFFTFDLSSLDLSSSVVNSATLELARYGYAGDATETVSFWDVSTDAATLNSNTGTNAAIFNDLGSGIRYGQFVVGRYTFSNSLTLSFALNPAALSDITNAAGGFFSIGGALDSMNGTNPQYLFGSSFGVSSSTQRLIVETTPVPEPGTLALIGIGVAGHAARRWRRCRI
jgi:hypothetical protein